MTTATHEAAAKPRQAQFAVWPAELNILFQLGHWATTDHVLSEALDTLLEKYPDLRARAAMELYRQDVVSLSRAAEIAGTDRWTFQDMLGAHGIEIVAAAQTAAEMDEMIRAYEAKRKA